MKKLLFGLSLGIVLLGSSVNLFADGVSAGTIGNPITIVEDTSILGAFPSRMQTVGMGKSALYVGVSGGAIGFGGFDIKFSPLLDLCYTYRGPSVAIPLMLRQNAALFSSSPLLHNPAAIIWAAKLGPLQVGVSYGYMNIFTNAITYETNGVMTAEDRANYQRHSFLPSLTLLLGDTMSFDASVNIIMQLMENYNIAPLAVSRWFPRSMFATLGANAQLTINFSSKFRAAVRVNISHSDTGYYRFDYTPTTSSSNEYVGFSDSYGGTLGLQYKPIEAITLYLSFPWSVAQNNTVALHALPAGNLNTANTTTYTLPPSTVVGMEVKAGNWRFRGYGSMTLTKVINQTYSPLYDYAINGTTTTGFSYGAGLGIGWVKLPWAINASFNPDLLNSTANLVSGQTIADPILSIQVNYLFDLNEVAAHVAN